MPSPYLIADLKRFEGCRLEAYQDTGGVWTIGWGHTPATEGQVWNQATADLQLAIDVGAAVRALDGDPLIDGWWRDLDPVRSDALVEMSFNLGEHTLDEFHNMLGALKASNWDAAADDALASKWAAEVNGDGRADFIATMFRTGFRPGDASP